MLSPSARVVATSRASRESLEARGASYASWLKHGGEDSMVVTHLLGHSSTKMVETIYGHLGNEN